jgi:predicted  nucleic acid-binding Zn-ribbon protein
LATPNIKDELRKLVELQEIDKKIFAFKKEKTESPKILEDLQKDFDQKKAKLKSLEESKQKLLLKQKEKEGELAVKEENIKKSQSQLGQLKTNKDYQTKLTEIEGFKADKSIIEEEILKLMDEVDLIKQAVDTEKINVTNEEKNYNEKKNVLINRLKEIETSLAQFEGKRKILSATVDKKILGHYEHILYGKDGLALVMVKNNSCHGCFMHVPHQVINEIKMHEHLVICETCSRILYLEEDVSA